MELPNREFIRKLHGKKKGVMFLVICFVIWKGVTRVQDWSYCPLYKIEELARANSRAQMSEIEILVKTFGNHLLHSQLRETFMEYYILTF